MPRGFHRGFGMRRYGTPLLGGMGMGMGGMGFGLGPHSAPQAPSPYPPYQAPQAPQAPQTPQAPPAATPSAGDDVLLDRLALLGELHERGVLTDEEFEREKKRLLDR